jgi:hypothetical protein
MLLSIDVDILPLLFLYIKGYIVLQFYFLFLYIYYMIQSLFVVKLLIMSQILVIDILFLKK